MTPPVLAAFAAIYIIWGTTFLGITLMLRSMPPFVGGGMRFLLAGALMLAWLRARESHPFAGLRLPGTVLCGVLLTGIGNGFLIWSQLALPSGIAALFVGSLPVWILILDWTFFARRRPGTLAILGVLLGVAGIAVLSLNTGSLAGAIRPIHVAAVIVAELAWALGTLLQPSVAPRVRAMNFTCLQMLVGAVFQLLLACADHEWRGFSFGQVSPVSWVALAWLTVFGSVIAFSCYSFLVSRVSPQKVATYALVNPLIALVLGATVLHERISNPAVTAMILVLLGVTLVLAQRERSGTAGPGAAVPAAEGRES
jgi:drug/metabolite transporter (DMT)-like permease